MSRTLNLIDLLLNSGRHLCDIGRTEEALEVLTRLGDFRQLPGHVIEETQALLADIYLQRENYVKARRHLTTALTFRPLKAEYHHMMAIAIEEDDKADLRRAEMYYEQAVASAPDNADYRIDFGAYLFRIGKSKAGLQAIRKGYALGKHDPDVVRRVGDVLREEEHMEEATTKLRAALFHNHGDERFRRVWQEHQFHLIRQAQREERETAAGGKPGPEILPFAPAAQTGNYVELGEMTIRFDRAESLSEPKTSIRLPFRKPPKG